MSEKTEPLEKLDLCRGLLKLHESFASEEEYRASNCLSYSKIKDIHDNPEVLTKEKEEVEKEWLTFGTMVDLMLTTPEEVEKRIFVNDKVPSEQFKKISDYMIANDIRISSVTEENVEEIYSGSGSAVNWKPATKVQKLLDECRDYINLLTEHKDKLIVSTEQFLEAQGISNMVKTHSWTQDYFMSEKDQLLNNVEIFYQYKIKYVYEGLLCKSMIDILYVDHDLKIICPIDFNTGTDQPRYFINHALYRYKYGYQGALYKEGIERFISKIPEFDGYEVDNFRFIYVSRLKPTFPLILEMGERCHLEFKDIGVFNPVYDIPALTEIMREASYYISLVNEGKTPTIPYDIARYAGIVLADGFEMNNALIY